MASINRRIVDHDCMNHRVIIISIVAAHRSQVMTDRSDYSRTVSDPAV